MCLKIANLVGDKPEYVLTLAQKERASEIAKPFWGNILKTLATATLAIYITLPFLYNSLDVRYIM